MDFAVDASEATSQVDTIIDPPTDQFALLRNQQREAVRAHLAAQVIFSSELASEPRSELDRLIQRNEELKHENRRLKRELALLEAEASRLGRFATSPRLAVGVLVKRVPRSLSKRIRPRRARETTERG